MRIFFYIIHLNLNSAKILYLGRGLLGSNLYDDEIMLICQITKENSMQMPASFIQRTDWNLKKEVQSKGKLCVSLY